MVLIDKVNSMVASGQYTASDFERIYNEHLSSAARHTSFPDPFWDDAAKSLFLKATSYGVKIEDNISQIIASAEVGEDTGLTVSVPVKTLKSLEAILVASMCSVFV